MTSFDSFKHAVHTVFKETVEAVTPISNISQFREKGVLTPEEFVAAGGFPPARLPTTRTLSAAHSLRSCKGVSVGIRGAALPPGGDMVRKCWVVGRSCNSRLQHAFDERESIRRRPAVRKVPLVVVAGRRAGQGGCPSPPLRPAIHC